MRALNFHLSLSAGDIAYVVEVDILWDTHDGCNFCIGCDLGLRILSHGVQENHGRAKSVLMAFVAALRAPDERYPKPLNP